MKHHLAWIHALAALVGAGLDAAGAAAAIQSLPAPYPEFGQVERLDPALDALLAPEAAMEKLAEGFVWSEGPVWMPSAGGLIFSDVPVNIAYRWREGAGVEVFLKPSGYAGGAEPNLGEGSNGLTLDHEGRLLLAQHGDRRLGRLNDDGRTFTTLVDRYRGKRFNSPNDLCLDRRGNIYFTDPPYGLGDKGVSELGFSGIYRLGVDGAVTLISDELERPNGIALSPDEKTLYVANSHGPRPIVMAFARRDDGSFDGGRVFFDSTALQGPDRPGAMDGMKVDVAGNVWATGPGGVLILDATGKHLGSLLTGKATANCCFGGPDGATLYVTAHNVLARIQTETKGSGL